MALISQEAGSLPKGGSAASESSRVARSIGEVHALLLLLTLLYYFIAHGAVTSPRAWFLTVAAFGAGILVLRVARPLAARPRLRLGAEAALMVAFITVLIYLSNGSPGPLLNLYLLPVVTTALVLGRRATLLQLGLIIVGRVAVGLADGGPGWFSMESLLSLFAEFSPTLLAAFLTSALAHDVNIAAQRIQKLSERDDLTGLLNMRTFTSQLDEDHGAAERRGSAYAILMVDLDGLKKINDRFGHAAGDRALAAVAEALGRATRATDYCARYGGDEFMVFLQGASREAADVVANRIRHHVYAATQDFDYAMRRLSVSIGIAVHPEDGRDPRALVQTADRSMYLDKHAKSARAQSSTAIPGTTSS